MSNQKKQPNKQRKSNQQQARELFWKLVSSNQGLCIRF